MNKTVLVSILAMVLIAGLAIVPVSRPVSAAQDGQVVPGQYIVKLAAGVESAPVAKDLGRLYGLAVSHTYSHAFNGFAARIPDAQLAKLQADPRVVSIVADRYVFVDAKPTPPPPANQVLPTGINRVDAELSATADIDNVDERVNVDVAVIDTGIDMDHADLYVVGGYNCILPGSVPEDDNGHGSHVAGTIGAKDNTIGVVGVAPGARLWAVKVLNKRGSGTWSQIICGIDWVTANAVTIEVANMSLGGGGTETGCDDGGMNEAICNAVNAGVTFVVAAGNESDDAAYHVPAAYDQVITVSALDDRDGSADTIDTFASFSNYGADVDLIAPGVYIYSTYKGGGYVTMSGTSMASPHVAGGAALYKATHPSATPAQVKSALQAAGTLDWNDAADPDPIKEKLLNVAGF
jgi:subtilisin